MINARDMLQKLNGKVQKSFTQKDALHIVHQKSATIKFNNT